MVVKTSVSIEENLLKRIDEHCEKLGVKRSTFIQQAVEHEFNMLDAEKAVAFFNNKNADDIYTSLTTLKNVMEDMTQQAQNARNNDEK